MEGVTFVHADASTHTVTVDVKDPAVTADVVRSLHAAGFAVGDPTVKEGEKR